MIYDYLLEEEGFKDITTQDQRGPQLNSGTNCWENVLRREGDINVVAKCAARH